MHLVVARLALETLGHVDWLPAVRRQELATLHLLHLAAAAVSRLLLGVCLADLSCLHAGIGGARLVCIIEIELVSVSATHFAHAPALERGARVY